ncbi:hypothetical protein [Synechococcus sp. CC9311]|uniref:hypothetical protein n=1 Tax=Synechococcus sp. (strain CC9311) TaxID=64471 RepID=UPI0003224FD4|nr:hypothetical protein [Synechococcus sp. CC9311]
MPEDYCLLGAIDDHAQGKDAPTPQDALSHHPKANQAHEDGEVADHILGLLQLLSVSFFTKLCPIAQPLLSQELPLDRLLALLTSVLWPFLELRERLTRPLLAKLYE